MAETQLITITDVRGYRDISANMDTARFNNYVTDIQRNHLRKLMGHAMYYDFWSKYPDSGVYDDLVNGATYEYGGNTIQYYGLKPYLCYLFLSVFIIEGDTFHVDYGNAIFTDNPQDHLVRQPYRNREEIRDYYISQANGYKCEITDFLNNNSSDYPLWQQEWQPPDPRNQIRRQTII